MRPARICVFAGSSVGTDPGFAAAARELGFESVAAGPLVRSSYHADESAREALAARDAA